MTMMNGPDGIYVDRREPQVKMMSPMWQADGVVDDEPSGKSSEVKLIEILRTYTQTRRNIVTKQWKRRRRRKPPPWNGLNMNRTGNNGSIFRSKRAADAGNDRAKTKAHRDNDHLTMDLSDSEGIVPTDHVKTDNNDTHFDIDPLLTDLGATAEEIKQAHDPFEGVLGVGNAIPAIVMIAECAAKVMLH